MAIPLRTTAATAATALTLAVPATAYAADRSTAHPADRPIAYADRAAGPGPAHPADGASAEGSPTRQAGRPGGDSGDGSELLRGPHTGAQERSLELTLAQSTARTRRAALIARWDRTAAQVVRYALRQRGRPYVWGGTGARGFDCSGLVQRSWRQAGVSIPRIAADQYRRISKHVTRGNLRPGDLVYFNGLGHVGLYVGGGDFVHAPHTGSYVQVARLASYWKGSYVGAARPGWPSLPPIPAG